MSYSSAVLHAAIKRFLRPANRPAPSGSGQIPGQTNAEPSGNTLLPWSIRDRLFPSHFAILQRKPSGSSLPPTCAIPGQWDGRLSEKRSNVANPDALLEGRDDILARGYEFLRYESLEAGLDNRLHHGWIVNLLGLVDLVPARHAARVI